MYFKPDKRQCLILGNFDYAKIRWTEEGKDGNMKEKGFPDLPEVRQDMEVFSRNIEQYGFGRLDIIQETNLDIASTKEFFNKSKRYIVENARNFEKTLTVVYYGGHGMMNDN